MYVGEQLWTPPHGLHDSSRLREFADFLERTRGLEFRDYDAIWRWSVQQLEDFWLSLTEFFAVRFRDAPQGVLSSRAMPGARWFDGSSLNYAEHIAWERDSDIALIAVNESGTRVELSYAALRTQVSSLAAELRARGVSRGDRVVAYLPNTEHAVIGLLACASLGAIWSSCSPEMGLESVLDRFQQITPKLLIATDGYRYGGKDFDRLEIVQGLRAQLPTLEGLILCPILNPKARLEGAILWPDALLAPETLNSEPVAFDHPLYILYSSGTTGLPKAIVHGHGGILLEHLKALGLQMDIRGADRFFWFTTTGWMMWNYLISGLLFGSSLVLWDGAPTHPQPDALWRLCATERISLFGCGAAFLHASQKAGLMPGRDHDLSSLRSIGSTGSPLSLEGFAFVYEQVKPNIWLNSLSGGTDVCSAFLGGSPWTPVWAGELSCRALGASVEAFDSSGRSFENQLGELVITAPLPSMPVRFWNDPDGQRYRESYFGHYPGVWRHGDWVTITERGSAVIHGRSDATINRAGVRIGTAELYSAVERIQEVQDSLVVDLERPGTENFMALFVQLKTGEALTASLEARIRSAIRQALSPRHVPDSIVPVPEIPRTLNGKKLELPIKRILQGTPLERVVNPGSLFNPRSLEFFVDYARRLAG